MSPHILIHFFLSALAFSIPMHSNEHYISDCLFMGNDTVVAAANTDDLNKTGIIVMDTAHKNAQRRLEGKFLVGQINFAGPGEVFPETQSVDEGPSPFTNSSLAATFKAMKTEYISYNLDTNSYKYLDSNYDEIPCASPDGRYIAFQKKTGTVHQMFIQNRSTVAITAMNKSKKCSGLDGRFSWAPDSQCVIFRQDDTIFMFNPVNKNLTSVVAFDHNPNTFAEVPFQVFFVRKNLLIVESIHPSETGIFEGSGLDTDDHSFYLFDSSKRVVISTAKKTMKGVIKYVLEPDGKKMVALDFHRKSPKEMAVNNFLKMFKL